MNLEFASEFYFTKGEESEFDEYTKVVIGEAEWTEDSIEFADDVWESFMQTNEFKKLENGDYFAFVRGTLMYEFSDTEYGTELDGIYPDFDKISIKPLPAKR